MSERMVNHFMEMVQIDSESGNEEKFISYLDGVFKELGGETQKDDYGNLMIRFEGRGQGKDKEIIVFACHADTVKPGVGIKPVLKDGVIRSSGDTILGADDKAGIAELIEALRIAKTMPPVEIIISRQEEVGLIGIKKFDFSLLKGKKGFLLDNDTLDTIIIGGPSYYTIDVKVIGVSAHAGMEPEKGINAIAAAAKAISSLTWGRLDEETTANVGVIQGGLIRNGVPDICTFAAECRSLNHEKASKLAKEIEQKLNNAIVSFGAKCEIKVENLCKAVEIAPDAPTVVTSQEALKTVGIEAKPVFMTGFTDASIINNMGIEMAVVGIGAKLEHSCDEHIYVEDMKKALDMVVKIMELSSQ